MKAGMLFLMMLLTASCLATIRTVSNFPATLAQFNTIQGAINASSSGDTILVHGSPNQYTPFNLVNKKITLIGPGWAPQTSPALRAVISATQIMIHGTGSSNSEFHGLVFTGSVNIQGGAVPSDIKFYRNEFTSSLRFDIESGLYTGYILQGNYFNQGTISGSTGNDYVNWVIENNLFKASHTQISGFANGKTINFMFNHNLFMNVPFGGVGLFSNCGGLLMANNIFVKRDASTTSFSTFNNNITWQTANNSPWTSNNNIDGGGNVVNQNPLMVDEAVVDAGTAVALDTFTIASGPANNSGSDGKDMGLFFDSVGALNWFNSRNARYPHVYLMSIANPVLGAGGTLNVTVEARKNE